MKSTPIRQDNAIDHISFVLTFETRFDDQTVTALLGMENAIADLPEHEPVNSVIMMVEQNPSRMPVSKPAGIHLQKPATRPEETGGKPEWTLSASADQINVSCMLYTRWDEVFAKASEYLFETLTRVDLSKNSVVGFAIHVEDVFQRNSPDDYQVSEVFNLDSDYLSKKVTGGFLPWHVHQGWFEDIGGFRILNNLNISTNWEKRGLHLSKIGHLTRVKLSQETPLVDANKIKKFVKESALICHDINKDVMSNLLSEAAKKEIGL